MKKSVSLWIIALILTCTQGFSQQKFALDPVLYHTFDVDSLRGFDEEAAKASAIAEGFLGKEFPVRMYVLKRRYINDKYNLWRKTPVVSNPSYASSSKVVPACTNEDFEASASGTLTTSNQVNGWTVTRGSNNPYLPNQSGWNSCNLLGCCPSAPQESAVFSTSTGYIDPVIGNCYPIFSVFGDGPGNASAATANPHIPQAMKGTNFIRINSNDNDYSIERLSKTFAVTSSNALFQFAFISVFYPGHGCCDAGAFQIRLLNASGGNSVIACPNFSASAPSAQCSNTTSGIQYLSTQASTAPCTPFNPNSYDPIFNKWQLSSMDLTSYIGQNITIEIMTSDCTAGGHYGYIYFDSQCGPMSILGNGTSFPAGSTNVVVPTCGPNGATICATPGLGPYSWAGPNIPPGYSTPSYSNQCFVTNTSSQYTLSMNPPGGCAPFTRIVNTTVTPAPTLVGNVVQAVCGGTLATITITPGGSAGNPAFISWYPNYYSVNSQSTLATYTIPATNAGTTIVTVTAADQVGCPVSLTLGVNPPAPLPQFAVVNNTGTYTLTCLTPTVSLDISTTYTYGPQTYFWASNSFTSSAQNVVLSQPGTYTVSLIDPISLCSTTKTVNIGANLQVPSAAITPTFQNITCTVGAVPLNASAINPSVNIEHQFVSPLGGTLSINTASADYVPGTVGTFTYHLVNKVNGCRTTKTFTINSSQGFPTFSLTSANNFSLGCNTRSVSDVNITGAQATPTSGGAVSYTLFNPAGLPIANNATTSAYVVNQPGTYTVVVRNTANGCETRVPISVLSNTLPPGIDTVLVPTYVLSCFTPSITLTGISYAPNINYNWKLPQNQNQSGDKLNVSADFTKPTQTTVATYTLIVEDNSSTCTSSTTVIMAQNLFPPVARIAQQYSLTCLTSSVVLSNISSPASANPFPKPLQMSAILWEGPSPQIPLENSSTYSGYYAGTYTMVVRDENNGCTSSTVHFVAEDREYPLLTPTTAVIPCGADAVEITPVILNPSADHRFMWESAQVTSSKTLQTLTVFNTGTYNISVLNSKNGCPAESFVVVTPDTLTAKIEADKVQGFAPLTINLHNLSSTRTGTDNIESIWFFGNGATATLASVSSTNATYTQPGTYTVMLYARRGACLQATKQIIVVDIPSQMIVPNVFTPNGDGINDLYFLQRSSNLEKLNATIYDRWGNKVYEVTSTTGQIEWDGNTMAGKTAPSGTYYYIITATGRDGKKYDEKGSLSLIR